MKKIIILLSFALVSITLQAREKLTSPSQIIEAKIENGSEGLTFSVYKNQELCGKIDVGIQTSDLDERFVENRVSKSEKKEEKCNEYLFRSATSDLQLEVKVFDDAFAFRYTHPKQQNVWVKKEYSSWVIPAKTKMWYFERRNDWKLKSYAGTWENCDIEALDTISGKMKIQGTPLILEYANGKKGFISEADLLNYSGLRLNAVGGRKLMANFTEGEIGFTVEGNFSTPWRILFVGDNLTHLVNQQTVKLLSAPPCPILFADKSYISAGKSVWRWFAKGTGDFEQEKKMIDYAAKLKFEFTVVDEGWEKWDVPWERVSELTKYARRKQVKVFLWKHSHQLMQPENDYQEMRQFLDSASQNGVAGVKVDFMDSERYSMILFDIKLLAECAKRRMMVNFHGCQSPAGESVSYPNEVTREGIRGIELNKMNEGYIPPYHNAALPFTRFVVGHGDYTPLTFTVPGETTFAHQLATLICFDSPMQMIVEDPQLLLTHPMIIPALDYIKSVPTVWDETRVLSGSEIGKLVIMARRSGKQWFVGVLNGENKEKMITIDLETLSISSKMRSYTDDVTAPKVLLDMKDHRPPKMDRIPVTPFRANIVKPSKPLVLKIAPYGGAVVWLK